MSSFIYDAATVVIDLLNDNWSAGQVPEITKAWKKRSVGFIDDRRDQIVITPKAEKIQYFGLYGDDHWHDITIDLDIRTYQDDERHNDIVKESIRILTAKIRGGSSYTDLRVISSYTRNQYMRNMFNHVLTVSIRKTNPS
tara:strand:- start:10887 stop:11306 length:420 start_codon:yes stop_codon:yes gene_type:complete